MPRVSASHIRNGFRVRRIVYAVMSASLGSMGPYFCHPTELLEELRQTKFLRPFATED